MNDPSFPRLLAAARGGRLTRCQALETGLRLGLTTPAIAALMAAAPARSSAAPAPALGRLPQPQGESTGTLTVLAESSSPDIDPHSQYNNRA